jgi:hypothetical protein
MTRNHEKLLVAVLAGLIIAGAAAFAISPSFASTTTAAPPANLLEPASNLPLPQLPARG